MANRHERGKDDPARGGDILRYRSRSRNKGEILCHNHVLHNETMPHGANGFRYFVARRGGKWKRCPCGWRPELGPHYAIPEHVEYQRKRIARGAPMVAWLPPAMKAAAKKRKAATKAPRRRPG